MTHQGPATTSPALGMWRPRVGRDLIRAGDACVAPTWRCDGGIALAPLAVDALWETWMRLLGLVLLVVGVVVLAYGGLSYTKSRHSTDIGPVQVSTVKKGFITPAAGAVMAVVGLVLVVAGRRDAV